MNRQAMVRMVWMAGLGTMLWTQGVHAKVYPVNACVKNKMANAALYCQTTLNAWAIWDRTQDSVARDAILGQAAAKLADKWGKADAAASAKGVACNETTAAVTDVQTVIDTLVTDTVTQINTGLDLLANKDNAICGMKLLKAAAVDCGTLLRTEATFIAKLDKDPTAVIRDATKAIAIGKFELKWAKATALDCPTTADMTATETAITNLNDQVVTMTTVSPNVDNTQYIVLSPTGTIKYEGKDLTPMCMASNPSSTPPVIVPYHFFAKRGSVNKLVMYYQGGGACWNQTTCGAPTCKIDANDDPNTPANGFADLTNPDNPFKDWNIVFVPYCSCDIHFGDASQDYDFPNPTVVHVEHRGYHNAKVAEKWAREHFVNPEMVFVTGSSAGAYGAVFHAPLLERVWPASTFRVVGDAGNGVITTDFLQNEFPHWNFTANLPPDIPGVIDSITNGTGIPGYMEAVADFFPRTSWANYATGFDGGSGGQTGFYNLMLVGNLGGAITWWNGSCAFHTNMVQQAVDTEAHTTTVNNNYRYYIGSGSRHTMWGSNKVYSDTTGGVPLLVDWINAMLANDPGWVNVHASPDNVLLPGDPQPSPLAEPFEVSGSDIIVNCP